MKGARHRSRLSRGPVRGRPLRPQTVARSKGPGDRRRAGNKIVAVARGRARLKITDPPTKVPGWQRQGCPSPMGGGTQRDERTSGRESTSSIGRGPHHVSALASALSRHHVRRRNGGRPQAKAVASSVPDTVADEMARQDAPPAPPRWPLRIRHPQRRAAQKDEAATPVPSAGRRCGRACRPGSAGGRPTRLHGPRPDARNLRSLHALECRVAGAADSGTHVCGCRERAPVNDLLPASMRTGVLVPDPRRRLPGRKVSVRPTRSPRGRATPGPFAPGPAPPRRRRAGWEAGPLRDHVLGTSFGGAECWPGAGE